MLRLVKEWMKMSVGLGGRFCEDLVLLLNQLINIPKLDMCSASTNGERACPAKTFQLISSHFSYNN